MIQSEIPSLQTERDTQTLAEAKRETSSQAEPVLAPTPRDRLVVASVSLVVLFVLAVMLFGASRILHAGTIGWLAILAMILFAVVTINVVMALSGSHPKRLPEQPPA